MSVDAFLEKFIEWAREQTDIEGVALVGSHARGEAGEDSDVDLMILVNNPRRYLQNREWLSTFGEIERSQDENWGRVETVRAFYRSGLEVEYGFAAPGWADVPVDAGTRRVVSEGMRVLFDPHRTIQERNDNG